MMGTVTICFTDARSTSKNKIPELSRTIDGGNGNTTIPRYRVPGSDDEIMFPH
jgi:hypothetical protein